MNDAFGFGQQAGQQVQGFDLRIAVLHREALRSGDRLLGFNRKFFESERHLTLSPATPRLFPENLCRGTSWPVLPCDES